MQIVRCGKVSDTDALVDLTSEMTEMITTMPLTAADMQKRLQHCEDSLSSQFPFKMPKTYFFVLEEDDQESEPNQIKGTSALYANIGTDKPFYNYKILHRTQMSSELEFRVEYRVLQPSNDFIGEAEAGTLYLPEKWRGGGRGSLLSEARFMFIAAHRDRFSDKIFSEIRGWTDDEGGNPFWDAIGQKFYSISMREADRRNGTDHRFMADLVPPYPIYIDLLPEEAQRVIGVGHDGAQGAARLLHKQGLRNNNYVAIFDAGLTINAHIDDTTIVRDSRKLPVRITKSAENSPIPPLALISNLNLFDFRVTKTQAEMTPEEILISSKTAEALQLEDGDPALGFQRKASK